MSEKPALTPLRSPAAIPTGTPGKAAAPELIVSAAPKVMVAPPAMEVF
jgi:hypothetical protein